jgi:RNA polymerase sigma-70 factor (ECF subfamily)
MVFVNIWENRNEFDFSRQAKSYLFTAVYNRSMNFLRDRKKFIDQASENPVDKTEDTVINIDHLEAAELENEIWKSIQSLPEKCREIFMLNRFQEMKYADIAQQLNISVKTVEAQMSKALKTLREKLKDHIHLILFLLLKNLW